MKKIIGISAQMQNGKDTVANYLVEKLGEDWKRVAFATGVKRVFTNTFGKDLEFIEKWKVNKEPPEGFKKTVRQALQFIGDGFREIQDNIWIDLLFRTEQQPMIISDVRYVNELSRVQEEGGINILVWRPGFENDDPNGSEAQCRPLVDFFRELDVEGSVEDRFASLTYSDRIGLPIGAEKVNFFLKNNGSIEDLYRKIDEVLIPYVTKKLAE